MHGSPAVVLNRKGRKRKSGRREPSGRCARAAAVDYRAMAALNPDRIGLPEALRTHERAGSSLGRLNLKKRISDHEYEAGQRYSVIVGAYRAMIGVPGHLVGAGKGYQCRGDAFCDPCLCRQRKERYDDAYCSIRTYAAHLAVNAVAIHDHDISPDQLVYLREGLAALARHFGLVGKGRN